MRIYAFHYCGSLSVDGESESRKAALCSHSVDSVDKSLHFTSCDLRARPTNWVREGFFPVFRCWLKQQLPPVRHLIKKLSFKFSTIHKVTTNKLPAKARTRFRWRQTWFFSFIYFLFWFSFQPPGGRRGQGVVGFGNSIFQSCRLWMPTFDSGDVSLIHAENLIMVICCDIFSVQFGPAGICLEFAHALCVRRKVRSRDHRQLPLIAVSLT